MKRTGKAIAVFLIAIILSQSVFPYHVKAATPLKILVLGDSIAKGYGLADETTESYGAIIGKEVGGTVENMGINGLKSGQLLDKLTAGEYDESIARADVIFLSIGSNDLLRPFICEIANAFGIDVEYSQIYGELQKKFSGEYAMSMTEMIDGLHNLKKDLNENQELLSYCKQFQENFQKIITFIKEKNPQTIIYVNNIYNPYRFMNYSYGKIEILNVYELTEPYIREMNQAFDVEAKEYHLLTLYSLFQTNGYTNVEAATLENPEQINFDPHPNAKGHQKIAELALSVMDITPPNLSLPKKSLAVDAKVVVIESNEQIHFIKGKKMYIQSDDEKYEYTMTGNEVCKKYEKGVYYTEIQLQKAGIKENLKYQTNYTIKCEEGSVKDSGNNSYQKEVIGTVETKSKRYITVIIAIIVLIGIVITGVFWNKKKKCQ